MWLKVLLGLSLLWMTVHCEVDEITKLFEALNDEVLSVNRQTAALAWDANFDSSNAKTSIEIKKFADDKRTWILIKCSELKKLSANFQEHQQRVYDLLCSGPRFTRYQQKQLIDSSDQIEKIYVSTRLCIPKRLNICREPEKLWTSTFVKFEDELYEVTFDPEVSLETVSQHVVDDLKCLTGEPDLEKLMANDFSAISHEVEECKRRKNEIQFWIWESWRVAVGPKIKEIYPHLVNVMNAGARKNNFKDIGDLWNHQLELEEDVEALMQKLMKEIQPLYNMLHAFVKSVLVDELQMKERRNIPAHILGWNANWQHIFTELIEPKFFKSKWNIDEAIDKANWNPTQMIKRVEDFYTSTGLNRMTNSFWNKSLIGESNNESCHGTAADMIEPDDFRMVACGSKNLYDFYVIVHELGHIEQYMLTQKQAAVFRAGNSIVQETIGDAIFLGMTTPMHLNRLRLIDDEKLYPSKENDFDLRQLMMMAFMKLPEIPFGFVFEKFRYDLFAERVSFEKSNDYFWELTKEYQRIEPPNAGMNRKTMFDAAAKFHLAANVPYARYFFANILQYQVFRALCQKTFFGRLDSNQTLPLPLHKCDIYGSKRAGSLLKRALTPGSFVSLKEVLKTLTGDDEISTDALKEYYEPLMKWLQSYLINNNIDY